MIQSKFWQSVGGVGILLLCGAFVIWTWHTAMVDGEYELKAVLFFPAFAVVGLGLLLLPLDFEKLQAEHGVSKPTRFAHYPIAWKILFFVALGAALANWYAISHLDVFTADASDAGDASFPRGLMSDLLMWTEVVLMFGGMFIALGGVMWDKFGTVAEFFGATNAKPHIGFRVALIGMAMFAAGLGLMYYHSGGKH